jgi:uncharacterized protein YbjT (DUF2867 family)
MSRRLPAAVRLAIRENQIIEISGPEAVALPTQLSIFEQATGRIRGPARPEAALQAQRNAAPDPMSQSFATLMLYCAKGDAVDMAKTSKQFSVQPKSVREFAKSATAGR